MKTITTLFIISLALVGFITTTTFAATDTQKISPELELIQVLGCKGCHTFAGKGGTLAANLDQIGTRLTAAEIEKKLVDGSSDNQNFMPSYKTVPTADRQSISSFLYNH